MAVNTACGSRITPALATLNSSLLQYARQISASCDNMASTKRQSEIQATAEERSTGATAVARGGNPMGGGKLTLAS